MSQLLNQRLQKRFTTAARVNEQVSYLRVIRRLQVRNQSGDYILNLQFDKSLSIKSYANGGDLYVDIFHESVRRGRKV